MLFIFTENHKKTVFNLQFFWSRQSFVFFESMLEFLFQMQSLQNRQTGILANESFFLLFWSPNHGYNNFKLKSSVYFLSLPASLAKTCSPSKFSDYIFFALLTGLSWNQRSELLGNSLVSKDLEFGRKETKTISRAFSMLWKQKPIIITILSWISKGKLEFEHILTG